MQAYRHSFKNGLLNNTIHIVQLGLKADGVWGKTAYLRTLLRRTELNISVQGKAAEN